MGIKQVLLSIDQAGNAFLGGNADETISARAYRLGVVRGSRFWSTVAKGIDAAFGAGHCKASYETELKRDGAPREYK